MLLVSSSATESVSVSRDVVVIEGKVTRAFCTARNICVPFTSSGLANILPLESRAQNRVFTLGLASNNPPLFHVQGVPDTFALTLVIEWDASEPVTELVVRHAASFDNSTGV